MRHIESKRVLITVRTYPTPALKGIEVSCTAGITDNGEWIRLYPVPYRRLPPEKRFKKYQWVELQATKPTSDPRPESFTPDIDSIRITGDVTAKNKWEARKALLLPLASHCLCCLERQRSAAGYPTLGLFRPGSIGQLVIESDDTKWSPEQLARLRQSSFFDEAPAQELEKIPYKFKYAFRCDHQECSGHTLMCTDWEMGESYRKWQRDYGTIWEEKFRQKYESEMVTLNDTHFYVGTLRGHPATWIIVGLFYPRR